MDGRRIPVWFGATLVVLLAALVGAPGTATAAQWRVGNERRAVLFGDSLGYEASSDFTFLAQLDGYGVEADVNGGTAPCDGSVVVARAPDGTHFCPTETQTIDGVVGLCPVPSPGAVRYAMGLAEGLDATPEIPIPDPPTAIGAAARTPAPAAAP